MRIGCLHTANINVSVFDAALASLGQMDIALEHLVRSDLLTAAEQAGGLTPEIAADTQTALLALCERNDAVLLTCSTLGPSIEQLAAPVPVMRVDEALARQAVADGGKVIALCAVKTTLAPTAKLFEAHASKTSAQVELRLVEGAWDHFKAGKLESYHLAMAEAAERAYADGAAVVAYAQASMSGALAHAKPGRVPLSSPVCGLLAASQAGTDRLR